MFQCCSVQRYSTLRIGTNISRLVQHRGAEAVKKQFKFFAGALIHESMHIIRNARMLG